MIFVYMRSGLPP